MGAVRGDGVNSQGPREAGLVVSRRCSDPGSYERM